MVLFAAGSGFGGQATITFESPRIRDGHRWEANGQTYRLFGIRTCTRGDKTSLPAEHPDCSVQTIARLSALLATSRVECTPLPNDVSKDILVVCTTQVGDRTLDLGLAMVATGYAFASLDGSGRPVVQNYLVAEISAKIGRHGLWATSIASQHQ